VLLAARNRTRPSPAGIEQVLLKPRNDGRAKMPIMSNPLSMSPLASLGSTSASPVHDAHRSAELDDYALGRSDAETRRLILQHQIYGSLTREFLVAAGISAGMKILELGSGAGDLALLLAELVGPQGSVLGVDMNADILGVARQRVDAAGWTNVLLEHHDVLRHDPGDDFDAVVGRWFLMYLPDPSKVLHKARAWVRPGGVVAFQEGDLRNGVRPYPPAPFHEQAMRWTTPPPDAPGPDVEMGLKLYRTFVDAGLPAPQLRLAAPIGGGPDWPGYAYLAETLNSLLPFLERVGAVRPGEIAIDTTEDRLRDEIVARTGVQILPALIGAWTRV
jgi:SAM-dependent methyltransferase